MVLLNCWNVACVSDTHECCGRYFLAVLVTFRTAISVLYSYKLQQVLDVSTKQSLYSYKYPLCFVHLLQWPFFSHLWWAGIFSSRYFHYSTCTVSSFAFLSFSFIASWPCFLSSCTFMLLRCLSSMLKQALIFFRLIDLTWLAKWICLCWCLFNVSYPC